LYDVFLSLIIPTQHKIKVLNFWCDIQENPTGKSKAPERELIEKQ
jgi:hypothetical protein